MCHVFDRVNGIRTCDATDMRCDGHAMRRTCDATDMRCDGHAMRRTCDVGARPCLARCAIPWTRRNYTWTRRNLMRIHRYRLRARLGLAPTSNTNTPHIKCDRIAHTAQFGGSLIPAVRPTAHTTHETARCRSCRPWSTSGRRLLCVLTDPPVGRSLFRRRQLPCCYRMHQSRA